MPIDIEQLKKAKVYAFLLLKYRPRTIVEFKEKLHKRGFDEHVIDELTLDFKRRGLLDDAKFAKMWLESRMSAKPMGTARLRQELRAKGVGEFDIEDSVDSAKSFINEDEAARALAQKKIRLLSGLDKITKRRRLSGFLSRRGFSFEVILKTVREALKSES